MQIRGLIILILLINSWFFNDAIAQNSVLGSGAWYKLAITENGVYALDYNFLQNNGIDPSTIDPDRIRIFGFGGGMLPQENSATLKRLTDSEIQVMISGGEDGSFDPGDQVIFYAQGPDLYEYTPAQQSFFYQKNLYADSSYVFLNIGSENGQRIQEQADLGTGHPVIRDYDDYIAYETDQFNIIKSGREWYGERFVSDLEQEFDFTIEGLKDNSLVKVVSSVMAASQGSTSFEVSLDDFILGTQSMVPIPSGTYSQKGRDRVDTLSINSNLITDADIEVKLRYEPSQTQASTGYLNSLFLLFQRDLALYDQQTQFRSLASLGNPISEFELPAPSNDFMIWDITDPNQPLNQQYRNQGGLIQYSNTTSALKEYIIFATDEIERPVFVGSISNQDILNVTTPNMLIVSAAPFLQEAERLASFRREHDQLTVEVVELQEIYNEFSSGGADVSAIRNYLHYLYDKQPGLQYLLLVGDCSYDYKDRVPANTNRIPTYQARNSLHPIFSYSSDDYFGFLEDNEGAWVENFSGDHDLEIGIGRLPVNEIDEAREIVDKIIHYSTMPSTFGDWRNEIYFVADDGDANRHQQDADDLAIDVDVSFSQFNVNKIYLDAFEQVSSATGETSQSTQDAISNAIEKGTLVMNYTGHGGETGWAQEKILDNPTVESWDNFDKLPLFVTATCEFGRNDDPGRKSGGELLVLNPQGGAIGLLTTTRPVFASSNQLVNQAFYEIIFDRSSGEYPRLGDVVRYTKNNSLNGRVNRNFLLLGDPSIRLNYPKDKVQITEINGTPVTMETDTISALSLVQIRGEVTDFQDNLLSDFNGVLSATVFDKPLEINTLGNEGPVFNYLDRDVVLFRGESSVVNGEFEVEFVVPKNIQFNYGNAKISFYANDHDFSEDANGSNIDLVVGGTDPNAPADNDPPLIELFMDDSTFVNGGLTSEDTRLLARLYDENGINISTSGIGQEITATLDGEETFVLNEFFRSDRDDFQKGWVDYPLKGLSPGNHEIVVKASDTYNNSNTETIEFIVAERGQLTLKELINYPNPFSGTTTFAFDHNRAGDDLEIVISIYSSTGHLISELKYIMENSISRVDGLIWDARGDLGQNMGAGLYLYRIDVRSMTDGSKNQQIEKLVIIN